MKHTLVGIVVVAFAAALVESCGGAGGNSGGSPNGDAGNEDGTPTTDSSASVDGTGHDATEETGGQAEGGDDALSDANVEDVVSDADANVGDASDAGCSLGTLSCNGQQPTICTGRVRGRTWALHVRATRPCAWPVPAWSVLRPPRCAWGARSRPAM